MQVHEIRVMRKGCKAENSAKVVFQNETLAIAEQQKIVDSFSVDQVVFISKSEQADIKASFYFDGKKVRICFICLSAAIQALLRNYPDKYRKDNLSIETDEKILIIDFLFTDFSKKEYNIMNHIQQSTNRNIHYWKHILPAYDGYERDCMLIEAPGAPLLSSDSTSSQKVVNPTLVAFENLDDFFNETLVHANNLKYRIQLKLDGNSYNDMFSVVYIQSLSQNQIIRLEYFSTYRSQLEQV
ncbi:MAG: hypothetical protein KBT36_09790 [Kurthia sp.]|nr:hypothetical protein [Candidatus Kurthia equi]